MKRKKSKGPLPVSHYHVSKCMLPFYKYTVTLHQPTLSLPVGSSWRSHSWTTGSCKGHQDGILKELWDEGGLRRKIKRTRRDTGKVPNAKFIDVDEHGSVEPWGIT